MSVTTEVVHQIAVIAYINDEGVMQTEMRSYPQDYEDETKRGMAVDDADYMIEQARVFAQDNPQFKSVFVRYTVTTDYRF